MGTHSSGTAVKQTNERTNKQAIGDTKKALRSASAHRCRTQHCATEKLLLSADCFKNGSFLDVLGKRKEPKGQQKGTAY